MTEIVNPATHRLEAVVLPRSGVRASITAGTTTTPITLGANAPTVWSHGGSRVFRFIAANGQKGAIIFLYGPTGGPPAAAQSYMGTTLVSTNSFEWSRIASGWMRTQSVLQIVQNGALVERVTTSTAPCRTNCGPATMVMREHSDRGLASSAVYAFARLTASDATAQWYNMYFSACKAEWERYSASTSAFMAASAALSALSGLALAAASGVVATLGMAMSADEEALERCMELQPDSSDSSGDGAGGGAGGGGTPPADCLKGSYAAHCTTPFTL